MTKEVLLPQWGMGMIEGTVLRWMKNPGDSVLEGEEIAEIETAKAQIMLEAPYSGTLTDIIVAEGETAEVRAVLAHIEVA